MSDSVYTNPLLETIKERNMKIEIAVFVILYVMVVVCQQPTHENAAMRPTLNIGETPHEEESTTLPTIDLSDWSFIDSTTNTQSELFGYTMDKLDLIDYRIVHGHDLLRQSIMPLQRMIREALKMMGKQGLYPPLYQCGMGEVCYKFVENVSGKNLSVACDVGWHLVNSVEEIRYAQKSMSHRTFFVKDMWVDVVVGQPTTAESSDIRWKWQSGDLVSSRHMCHPFERLSSNTCVSLQGNRVHGACLHEVPCSRQRRALCISNSLRILPASQERPLIEFD